MGYVLTGRAMDIVTSEKELCYILGYLERPGRIKYIEAQVPYGKENEFMNAYPGADFGADSLCAPRCCGGKGPSCPTWQALPC